MAYLLANNVIIKYTLLLDKCEQRLFIYFLATPCVRIVVMELY